MFVGDSISYNQWQSLICMLHAAVPWARTSLTRTADLSNLYFVVGLISLLFPFLLLRLAALFCDRLLVGGGKERTRWLGDQPLNFLLA